MIPTGKCPKCGMVVNRVNVEEIQVFVGLTPKWPGVSFVCPSCCFVLGVGIDPVYLKNKTIDEVVRSLRDTSRGN